jgi:Uma2 family endonuclease
MSILEHDVRSADAMVTSLHRHLLSREQYYLLADAGAFGDARVELIEGEIVVMAPIGHPHAAVTHPLAVILGGAFGDGYTVRNQVPISLGESAKPSDPQPDLAVVVGHWRDYIGRNPIGADVKLVVEIADSSLSDDRKVKSALYAAAGIPEYWIVNLVDVQLEVYRQPEGEQYATVQILRPGDVASPLLSPQSTIAVEDFLP